MNATAAPGDSLDASAGNHVHPRDTSKIDRSALGQPGGPAMLDAEGHFAGLSFVFGSANFATVAGYPVRPYTSPDGEHAHLAGGDYTAEYPRVTGEPIWQVDQDNVVGVGTFQSATYDRENNVTVVRCAPGDFGTSGYASANPGATFICGAFNAVSGIAAYAEGMGNESSGLASHAEGAGNVASQDQAHAEGAQTVASGNQAHAEGNVVVASGITSHAEGYATVASGNFSHAEGDGTVASGNDSHAEGQTTTALAKASHAEGCASVAGKMYQFAQASGRFAVAGDAQHTQLVVRRRPTPRPSN